MFSKRPSHTVRTAAISMLFVLVATAFSLAADDSTLTGQR